MISGDNQITKEKTPVNMNYGYAVNSIPPPQPYNSEQINVNRRPIEEQLHLRKFVIYYS